MARRAADAAIAQGRVTINGRTAVFGDMIDPAVDEVAVDGQSLRVQRKWYLALNKPKYVLTTMHDPHGRRCIKELIPKRYQGVFPVGRLDFDAEGLLLLTNDGDLAHAIHHPSYSVPKEYLVGLVPHAEREALERMAAGVMLDGRLTRAAEVERLADNAQGTRVRIVLRQGLKNQIKRMAEAVGLKVESLRRVSVGPVRLQGLRPGEIRELSRSELAALRKIIENQKVT